LNDERECKSKKFQEEKSTKSIRKLPALLGKLCAGISREAR